MWEQWEAAAAVDPTLKLRRSMLASMRAKLLSPGPYSRKRLFSRMMRGEPSIFTDFPVSLRTRAKRRREFLSRHIEQDFPRTQLARTQINLAPSVEMQLHELMRRWQDGSSIVSVTDLHFRKTRFEQILKTAPLSDFNVLCEDPHLIKHLEMMTLVVSSKGNLTDTHTDDCDGSNHCLLGKKLWLAWDRMEGKAQGFEDVDRDCVTGFARFDLGSFLSLPSARWFVVSENETLFLPGNLSHKVITLEDYVGVGSFHVGLPGYVRSLSRWILYDTVDVQPYNLLPRINRAVLQTISRVARASPQTAARWGLSFLRPSINHWRARETAATRNVLMQNKTFATFLRAAGEAQTV